MHRRVPAGTRRSLLTSGRVVNGVFLKLPAPPIVDIVAGSGFDFVVIDREHSLLSEPEALQLIERARLNRLPALLRLPRVDADQINRALEAGAAGIQLSMVRTVEAVKALRRAARYPPDGERSISLAHPAGGYGGRGLDDYGRDQDADPPLIVAQIETEDTDDPLEEIFRAGADVAFIGGLDLTYAMRADPEAMATRVRTIAAAAERTRTLLGGAGIDDPRVAYTANHSDVGLLRSGCASVVDHTAGAEASVVSGHAAPRESVPGDVRRQLEDLLVEFAYRLDIDQGSGVADLFGVDGSYTVDGETVWGREAINAGYERRANRGPRTGRHLVSNVRVTMLSRDRARIQSCLVLFAADGEPVLASDAPLVVGDFTDIAVRPGADWLFESRDLQTVFRGDGPVVLPSGVV